jgi:MSHA biogenesis protein MshO
MRASRAAGFTLFELIITITLLAILSGVVALFIARPMEGYFGVQRRAELTDVADTALRRVGRDVRLALPNSVRLATAGGATFLELLLTKTGGRYRFDFDDGTVAGEDVLDFSAPDSQFDTLEPLSTLSGQTITVGTCLAPNDRVVVHNLGISGADAYSGDNTSPISAFSAGGGAAANEDRIGICAKQFPLESPGRRFHVISGPVTFECAPGAVDGNGDGTGQLRRVSNYTISATQPTGTYGGSPITAVLANYVTACTIEYTALVLQARGLVAIRLTLTRANEAVTLYYEAHVNNVP